MEGGGHGEAAMINLVRRMRFWASEPRIGPDMPLTHWLLHFPEMGRWLAKRKFATFGLGSSLRPHCYLVRTDRIMIGAKVVTRPSAAARTRRAAGTSTAPSISSNAPVIRPIRAFVF